MSEKDYEKIKRYFSLINKDFMENYLRDKKEYLTEQMGREPSWGGLLYNVLHGYGFCSGFRTSNLEGYGEYNDKHIETALKKAYKEVFQKKE
jgi:hypothetical protein